MNLQIITLIVISTLMLVLGACGGHLGGDSEVLPPPVDSSSGSTDDCTGLCITSHSEGAAVASFKETFTGTCDDSYSLTVTAGNTSTTKILSSSCSGTSLSISIGFTHVEGSVENRSITVENGSESLTRTISFRYACPANFIGVPGDEDMGTSDFCVAKYEMKAETNGGVDKEDGSRETDGGDYADCTDELDRSNYIPESRASGRPWVCITQVEALNECPEMNAGGFIYRLISNEEWQTIARNAENVDKNWFDGTEDAGEITAGTAYGNSIVGTGGFARGNNGLADNLGYNGANPAARDTDLNSKGRLALSNGEEIWDFSANVWEWTDMGGDELADDLDYTAGGAATYYELDEAYSLAVYPTIVDGTTGGSYSLLDFMPKFSTYQADYADSGFGRIYFATNPTGRAALRGGHWTSDTYAGAFAAYLNYTSGISLYLFGFRCSAGASLLSP